jgi:hypothetical protein
MVDAMMHPADAAPAILVQRSSDRLRQDPLQRTADPYRDLAVIDERAPRFNQATIGALAALAVATGAWPLFALLAAQLSLGLTFGRRWCLPCVFYFEVVQPRVGEGPLEDSRPVRFANQVGAVFLWSATLAGLAGFARVSLVLGGTVAVLALLAAATGLCVGCSLYRLGARLRGVKAQRLSSLDLAELGVSAGSGAVVQFTHPLCSGCNDLARKLGGEGRSPVLVDISKRPDLARKYGVSVVPLAFEVDAGGVILRQVTA